MNKQREVINKKVKTYFIIVNLIFGIIAFSYLVSAQGDTSSLLTKSEGPIVGKGFTTGQTWGLPKGAVAQNIPITEGGKTSIWKGVSGAKVLEDGTYELTTADGTVGISKEYGEQVIGKAGLTSDAAAITGKSGAGWTQGISNFFTENLLGNLFNAAVIGGLGALVGSFAGGKDGAKWGFIA